MKYDEFHKLVRANGWVVLRQMGTSHIIYIKGNRTYPVPYHRGRELGKGLERKMKKDMKIIRIK
ncbi:MAG: type II toxin-antitoxin system HicA family toxin [Bacteroidales bacterium]|nr:type II toxin-antitoxin system HicA family toxin [Bacteroidales bacterium]